MSTPMIDTCDGSLTFDHHVAGGEGVPEIGGQLMILSSAWCMRLAAVFSV